MPLPAAQANIYQQLAIRNSWLQAMSLADLEIGLAIPCNGCYRHHDADTQSVRAVASQGGQDKTGHKAR